MMNKKGFSLIELISVIVILAIIMSIGVLSYNSILNNTKNKSYKTYEGTMQGGAMMYIIDNGVPNDNKITLQQLLDDNRVDYFNDPNSDSKCLNSYVEIIKNGSNSDLSYKVCLICPTYKSNGC